MFDSDILKSSERNLSDDALPSISASGSKTPPQNFKRSNFSSDEVFTGDFPMTNQSKASSISNDIMFFLIATIKNELFPKRVMVDALRDQTIKEIELIEQKKS